MLNAAIFAAVIKRFAHYATMPSSKNIKNLRHIMYMKNFKFNFLANA